MSKKGAGKVTHTLFQGGPLDGLHRGFKPDEHGLPPTDLDTEGLELRDDYVYPEGVYCLRVKSGNVANPHIYLFKAEGHGEEE